jgi:hypothetical protein
VKHRVMLRPADQFEMVNLFLLLLLNKSPTIFVDLLFSVPIVKSNGGKLGRFKFCHCHLLQ